MTRQPITPPQRPVSHFGWLCGNIGRFAWINSDPSGTVCITGTPYWGKCLWLTR